MASAFSERLTDWLHAGEFHKKLRHLALPMACQSVLSSSLQIMDTLMIARLGDTAVAAVGLANKLTFLFSFFLSTFASGVSIYAAQSYGEGNQKRMYQVHTLSLMLLLPFSLLFLTVALFLPHGVLQLFSQDEAVITQGCDYLRLIAPCYLIQSVTNVSAAFYKAVKKPGLPLFCSILSLATNLLLNYVFIFGRFGCPAMGARGAAIATLVSALLEMLLLLLLPLIRREKTALRPCLLSLPEKSFIRSYLHTTVPVFVNEVGWGLAVVVQAWVYAQLGTEAAAASSVYETIKTFIIICCTAVGSAGGILIGHALGAGDEAQARATATRMLITAFLLSLAAMPFLLLLISPLLSLYGEMSAQALHSLRWMLVFLSVLLWIKSFNYCFINGILRAGGDTKAAAYIDVSSVWYLGVPFVFVTGYLLHWPLEFVFLTTFAGDINGVLRAFRRYKKGFWVKKLT